jgi:hypothetical protein|tara:strand:+ start:152 stop:346 length:195 start_codon:yes stop_codon:yes gene_type:complete
MSQSLSNEREELLTSYARAQYHMGIPVTLEEKRRIVGQQELSRVPIKDLKKLIRNLRRMYKNGK